MNFTAWSVTLHRPVSRGGHDIDSKMNRKKSAIGSTETITLPTSPSQSWWSGGPTYVRTEIRCSVLLRDSIDGGRKMELPHQKHTSDLHP